MLKIVFQEKCVSKLKERKVCENRKNQLKIVVFIAGKSSSEGKFSLIESFLSFVKAEEIVVNHQKNL